MKRLRRTMCLVTLTGSFFAFGGCLDVRQFAQDVAFQVLVGEVADFVPNLGGIIIGVNTGA